MGLLDALLPVLDIVRGIPDTILGIRTFTVALRVVSSTGPRPGMGQVTVADTVLRNASPLGPGVPGGPNSAKVAVRQITDREVIASGGLYKMQDLRVGPLTPQYALPGGGFGGVPYSLLEPFNSGPGSRELYFKVTHSETNVNVQGPAQGTWYTLVNSELGTTSAMSIYITLRRSPVQNPGGVP